jgi:DNA-binding MarR family transcriptional regulator
MTSTDDQRSEVEFITVWNVLTRGVSAAQHTMAARAEASGISAPYVPVLLLLLDAEQRRLPMSRIARDLAMTSGGFTKLADRMARDGLIDRRGSSGDRRVVFAALTDAGLAVAHRASAVYVEFLQQNVLSAVSPEQLRQMAGLGERLRAANEPADAEAPTFTLAPRSPDAPERRSRRTDD